MTIHSQEDRPQNAYVAVQHRGWWFYIADDDQSSKATFSLLNILFSLQSATGKGKSPLLTLPVGKRRLAQHLARYSSALAPCSSGAARCSLSTPGRAEYIPIASCLLTC